MVKLIPNLDEFFRNLEKVFFVRNGILTTSGFSRPSEELHLSPESGKIKLNMEFAIFLRVDLLQFSYKSLHFQIVLLKVFHVKIRRLIKSTEICDPVVVVKFLRSIDDFISFIN